MWNKKLQTILPDTDLLFSNRLEPGEALVRLAFEMLRLLLYVSLLAVVVVGMQLLNRPAFELVLLDRSYAVWGTAWVIYVGASLTVLGAAGAMILQGPAAYRRVLWRRANRIAGCHVRCWAGVDGSSWFCVPTEGGWAWIDDPNPKRARRTIRSASWAPEETPPVNGCLVVWEG